MPPDNIPKPQPVFKYNVWTKCHAEMGLRPDGSKVAWPETSWHLLETNEGLSKDEATRRELTGNRNAKLFDTHMEYTMLRRGQRP